MAQREIINKIKLYLKKLTDAGIIIDKAYLYGSYARGSQITKDSDIDVMIVSKSFETNIDKAAAIVWRLTGEVDIRIEPYIVAKSKFETDDVSPLLQIVKKEGIEIK
ncbi:MAG TPA: nucleotidyltransferase domain-containing protein [Ignavibacteria bacterium]|jgi:predicted nucleotidyltransferase